MGRILPRVWGAVVIGSLFALFLSFHAGGFSEPVTTIAAANAEEEVAGDFLTRLMVEPLYRSVRISWKVKTGDFVPVTFEIYRKMATADGEYRLVTSIKGESGKKKYKYVDKDIPVEENYLYKVVIPEKKQTYGPHKVRPPFSLPTT